MIQIGKPNKLFFTLKPVIGSKTKDFIIKDECQITDEVISKKSYVYFKKDINKENFTQFAIKVSKSKRNYQIDVASFVTKNLSEFKIINILIDKYMFANADNIYNAKTNKKTKSKSIILINTKSKSDFQKTKICAEAVNWTRNLQTLPPNILNSEKLAHIYKKDLSQYKNLKIKVLDKKQIKELQMELLLSVNSASFYEPRVVVVEYNGNPKSKEKTTFVGKGITFDSGGMNIKTGTHMSGMKYDMSGSAIVMGAIKAIAQIKPKINVSAIVALTDNVISSQATVPDSVFKSMSGKTVEVNNTDAEGRLVMADAITYAVNKMKSTRIVDVATLTGAIVVALGSTYTGVWSTTQKGWDDIKTAAKKANELVWRMPLHSDYFKFMKTSKVADMFNTDLTGKGGSSSAAMFLKQFSDKIEHIHFDVAGTADIKSESTGIIVKTLIELSCL